MNYDEAIKKLMEAEPEEMMSIFRPSWERKGPYGPIMYFNKNGFQRLTHDWPTPYLGLSEEDYKADDWDIKSRKSP